MKTPLTALLAASLAASSTVCFAESVEDSSLINTAFSYGRSVTFNEKALLMVNDGVHGDELWVSDGTNAGTHLVLDLTPGPGGSNIRNLTVASGTVFFTAGSGDLWRTDGSAAGTTKVKAGINADSLMFSGSTLYFTAGSGSVRALWKSDGTSSGTLQVSAAPLSPSGFCVTNGTLYFAAGASVTSGSGKKKQTTTLGEELWKSDGTAVGTVLVKDINPGFNGSTPNQLTALNGVIFFAATTSNEGEELWRSDGTSAGTVLVKDLVAGSNSSSITRLRSYAGKLFFDAYVGLNSGLWQSDGTSAGTVFATTFAPGVTGFIYADFAVLGGHAILKAENANGAELWASDGTASGTKLLRLLVDNSPAMVEVALDGITTGGQYFFQAHDYATGTELYVTDGTVENTRLVKDIFPTNTPFMPPLLITANSSRVFFAADEGTSGLELWVSNGTTAGTTIVRDFLAD